MRNKSPFARQSNSKPIYYAIGLAILLGICVVILQDIQAPQEHVSQEIEINLDA